MTILGIDAGATTIKAGRFTPELRLVEARERPSGAARGWVAYFDSIAAAAEELSGPDTQIMGLAVPALLTKDGRDLRAAANVAGSSPSATLADELAARLSLQVTAVENDANCAALAEWQYGHGEGKSAALLHITWGTGIGTGFVTGGRALYGWEGGHLPLSWGRGARQACGCGSKRDLEAYCAVPHLVEQSQLAPPKLLAAAEAGEERAREVIDEAARWLARGLHMMSVLVYPDVVTIGGGFMASDWLLERVREQVGIEGKKGKYLADALRPDMVRRAKLGNEAGMIGAALLAREKLG